MLILTQEINTLIWDQIEAIEIRITVSSFMTGLRSEIPLL